MSNLLHDMRYALRLFAKMPGFTTVAILTLALGFGANTAIFSVVNAVLLRPLPFRDPSRLVLAVERSRFPVSSTSFENYSDWRGQSTSFVAMEAARAANLTLTGAGEPERLPAQMATAGFFPLLGVDARIGRTFALEEDRAGGTPVAVLGYGLWQRRFGGSRDAIGKAITLDSQPYTVIGVLPPDFQFLQPADVFIPFMPWARTLPQDRSWHPGIVPVARLKPGVSLQAADAEMRAIAGRLEKQYPDYNTGFSAGVIGLHEQIVQNVRSALLLILGAVSLVLLIACANVANLLLARAAGRRREVALRTVLGAPRSRILRQLLTESLVLSLAGAVLGLLIAWASVGPLLKISAGSVPDPSAVSLDKNVLLFTLALSFLTGLVFGLFPALRSTKVALRENLNESGRGATAGPGQNRLRSLLVASEMALALILLVGAGLLLRSFERLQSVNAGFRPDHLLVADLPLPPATYRQPQQRFEFFDRLLEAARSLPGVRSAGAASFLPVSGGGSIIHFNIRDRAPKSAHDFIAAGYRTVSADYFETLGLPLLHGRLIARQDNERAPTVVVINSSMASAFFPNESPVGKHIQLGALPDKDVPWMEIVGIVGDVRPGLGLEPQAEMYVPFRQADAVLPVFQLSIVLRTAADPLNQTSALRAALSSIDPNQPLVRIRTMEDNIAATIAQPRFRTWLLGIFSGLALILAAIGVYGLMSYSVQERTGEIGVRVSLGAQPADVFRLIVGHGLRLAFFGLAGGFIGSLALTRLMRSFLFGVSAFDPVTFASVAILLALAALAASWLPARRATRVDPIVALRHE